MPVDLSAQSVGDALARLEREDPGAARDAEAAFGWLGWHEEGPKHLRRYDIQMFVWYVLPRKFLASVGDKQAVALGLARFLESLGGSAASYADVCRAPDSLDLVALWERDGDAAHDRFVELLKVSGLEPPDTPALAWSGVMGLVEAQAHEDVATALETAIEDGTLSPAGPAFARRQAEVVTRVLATRAEGIGDSSRLEAVHAERLERWLRGCSEERRLIVDCVAPLMHGDLIPPVERVAHEALAPALWLLELGQEGIALTQTGALNRALVRETAERWPSWWNAELHGPPHREDDLVLLCELHELLRAMRLMRRSGRRLVTSGRGRLLRGEPVVLLRAIGEEILAGDGFQPAVSELAAALLVSGAEPEASALAQAIQPAVISEGWRTAAGSLSPREVSWTVSDFMRVAEAAGLLKRPEPHARQCELTPAGRYAFVAGLRAWAIAPVRGL